MLDIKVFPAEYTLSTYAKLVLTVLAQRLEMWAYDTSKHTPTNAVIATQVGVFVYYKTLASDDRPAVTVIHTEKGYTQEVDVENNDFVVVNGQVIHIARHTDVPMPLRDGWLSQRSERTAVRRTAKLTNYTFHARS